LNGKFILLLIVSINLFAFVFAAACVDAGTSCGANISDTYILGRFFSGIDTTVPESQTGLQRSSEFVASSQALTEPTAVGASIFAGLSVIVDAILMIISLVSLLTPLPILDLINSFGFPFYITLAIGAIIVIPYIISVAEFVSGRTF